MPKGEKRARAWCYTLNNPTEDERRQIKEAQKGARYGIHQLEVGAAGGTPHIQGYIYFENAKSLQATKGVIGARAHLEAAHGTPAENRNYCSKDEGRLEPPIEDGVLPEQGKRNDINDAIETLRSGGGLRGVAASSPSIVLKYPRGLQLLDSLLNDKERTEKTELWIFYGEPGTGKSHSAYSISEGGQYSPIIGNSGIWWDGYNGQPWVIFDEFKCNIPLGLLKRLADSHPLTVDIKGGSRQFTSKYIIITSNLDPMDWYGGDKITDTERAALLRRFTFVARFGLHGITIEKDDRANKEKNPVHYSQAQ